VHLVRAWKKKVRKAASLKVRRKGGKCDLGGEKRRSKTHSSRQRIAENKVKNAAELDLEDLLRLEGLDLVLPNH